jgi:hypothetical protein
VEGGAATPPLLLDPQERRSFLQKRTKKLLSYGARVAATRVPTIKVFGSFFAKKNCFLPYLQ